MSELVLYPVSLSSTSDYCPAIYSLIVAIYLLAVVFYCGISTYITRLEYQATLGTFCGRQLKFFPHSFRERRR